MADNSHGSKNELEIVKFINNKKFSELNLTMKEFIKYICLTKSIELSDNTMLLASYEKNNKLKQDIYITIGNDKIGVSLKMGSGNSCHQEKIEDFVEFIKNECNADDKISNLWRFFIWADGTYDGSGANTKDSNGRIKCRFDTKEFKKNHKEKRDLLQEFVDQNREQLINRVIFVGKHGSDVEFIYHGTYREGRWISKKEVVEFLTKKSNSTRACLALGNLTIQAWNVSLNGSCEQKRGEIQFKYGSMQSDFDLIMKENADIIGTFQGDLEEFALSHTMNKNKKNTMWKSIFPNETDFSNYYVVKVSSNQYSSLSGKKVKTKSDAYVVKMELEHKYLLSKEFILDEKDIDGMEYSTIENSGISVKMKSAKKVTYQKLTKASFCKAFSDIPDVEFWLISLLVYSEDNKRIANEKIITDLELTLDEYLSKVSSIMNIDITNVDSKSFWDSIRCIAQEKIKGIVESNIELKESIFMGKHWFKSPYHADFIYEKGKLKENKIQNFSITTGSGRSKGNYTITFCSSKSI